MLQKLAERQKNLPFRIAGIRITVYDVFSYLAAGMSREEILTDFPYLTEEDISACLAYAKQLETI